MKTEVDYEIYRKEGISAASHTTETRMARSEVHSIICTEKWHGEKGGIQYVAKIKHIQMQQNDGYVHFELEPWKN